MYAYTLVLYIYILYACTFLTLMIIQIFMGAMGLDSTLNIAHRACAKYSTLNKISHVNCAKTGDMEIAHVNVLEIAHHFSLCI